MYVCMHACIYVRMMYTYTFMTAERTGWSVPKTRGTKPLKAKSLAGQLAGHARNGPLCLGRRLREKSLQKHIAGVVGRPFYMRERSRLV